MAAPWLELAEDVTDAAIFYAESVLEVFEDVPRAGVPDETCEWKSADSEMPIERYGGWLFPAMAAASLLAPPPASTLVLASVTLPTSITGFGVAAVMLVGCYRLHVAKKDQGSKIVQTLQQRSILLTSISCAVHVITTLGVYSVVLNGFDWLSVDILGLPFSIIEKLPSAMCAHFLVDLIAGPLLIANIGVVGGASQKWILPATVFNLLGTGFMVLSISQSPLVCCGFKIVFNIISWDFLRSACMDVAHNMGPFNEKRVNVARDVMLATWSLPPVFQALSVLGILPSSLVVPLLTLTDVPGKLGVSVLTLRSTKALEKVAQHS